MACWVADCWHCVCNVPSTDSVAALYRSQQLGWCNALQHCLAQNGEQTVRMTVYSSSIA